METKFYPQEKLRQDILKIVGNYLDVEKYRIFFFGSRVGGEGSERSDIDIGIEGEEPIPVETIGRIREDLANLKTLYSFDVVDFRRAGDDFREVAGKYVEIISPRK